MLQNQPFLELCRGMLWAEQMRMKRLLRGFLILPVYETDIYTDLSPFFSPLDLDRMEVWKRDSFNCSSSATGAVQVFILWIGLAEVH